ncbi:hypothetical protein AUK11_03475 [bacterium CG2_30_37_16]|nr:MAG: hypothetical protein AUK11_03475 [bacterium CG2_30_37_16]PIP31245.1 MAG: hypothetical protein COX25_00335 [bacterium (Candidatus Howlettbacteria) CG23_combo_of_CG06-09_8_20_14_all_37_9]PIY00042.1 MAG: hypothetical protein COZ22_01255 [bacterium (Candidatus Howlettbacteria) CG_4_10_14_3_um_filter_37_10]PJB05308.1 MAG: hypothetical protein CO123_04380 [bacterium (Candidatus Howlettbacteria) CG_4_9_14_3_um_filter_37_10]
MAKKKKTKKYHLDHLVKTVEIKPQVAKPEGNKIKKEIAPEIKKQSDGQTYFKKDLKKVIIVGSSFVLLIVALDLVIRHTNLLDPVLKLFKIK